MRIYIEMDENEAVLYKQIGAKPEIVLTWLHREIVKILRRTENIYGTLKDLDEELLAQAIIDTAGLKKAERLKNFEKNKVKAKDRKRKQDKIGKNKKEHLHNLMKE